MNTVSTMTPPPCTARDSAASVQFGAIPYRVVEGRVAFMLITSRRTGRWIFPKGGLIDGLSPAKSAAREAFEEAGVEGRVGRTPIGSYRTVKQRTERTLIEVEVFPLCVERELDDWPEKGQRQRQWASLEEVRHLVTDEGAAELAARIEQRVA